MKMIVGSYSIKNLIQNEEFLLELTKSLKQELDALDNAREEVKHQQKEAHKQGILVKKMTNYMSEELARIELENSEEFSPNFEKLSETETKLRVLRGRLSEFVNGDDEDSLESVNMSIEKELKQYESFLLDFTHVLNEKIANFEKIINRLKAENKESQQQKILLEEMVELFNDEINDLENTFSQLKQKSTNVS